MKVFLSWSGAKSHAVARAFHDWLPSVIQEIDPWLSSDSIGKGEAWLKSIRDALSASGGVGIFFLTPEALTSEWLLFEAGGIAALGEQRVCTVCIDVLPGELKPPLNFYQTTRLDRADIQKLVSDLNKIVSRPVAANILSKTFDRAWSDLDEALKKAEKVGPAKPKPKADEVKASVDATVLEALRRIEGRLGSQETALQALRQEVALRTYVSPTLLSTSTPSHQGLGLGSGLLAIEPSSVGGPGGGGLGRGALGLLAGALASTDGPVNTK
jgi:hypothetical protein